MPVEVVSLLDVVRADIHVRDVAADAQLVAEELRRLEAARRAVVLVVVADDRAVLIRVADGHEERAPIIAAGDGEHVVERVAGRERLVPVIVCRRARGASAPSSKRSDSIPARRTPRRRRVILPATEAAAAECALLTSSHVAEERSDSAWPGATTLRRDEDDALGRARAVDRRRRGALQDLDRLDVVRVDVGRAIGCCGALGEVVRS